jgi:hypothetical protein
MGRKPNPLDDRDATRIEAHGLRMSDKYPGLTDSLERLVDELLQPARDGEQEAENAEADAATGAQQTTLPIAEFRRFCRLVKLENSSRSTAASWVSKYVRGNRDFRIRIRVDSRSFPIGASMGRRFPDGATGKSGTDTERK